MEVQDGFIVGIHNYCDRWCEACAFTSRCPVFAESARTDAALDPSMKALVDAPLLPQDRRSDTSEWLQKIVEEAHKLAESSPEYEQPVLPPESRLLHERALEYAMRCHDWLKERDDAGSIDPADAIAVIGWIPSKIHRALAGLAEDDPSTRDWPADHDGSAKIALIAIERSSAAWLALVEKAKIAADVAEPFVSDLLWMEGELERMLPNARAFIRPGFDEPDEVARLD
jgi:hypothetical protein